MKKNQYLLILIAMFVSCSKDKVKGPSTSQNREKLTVEMAKNLLNSSKSEQSKRIEGVGQLTKRWGDDKIRWDMAVEYSLNGYEMVEVPYKPDSLIARNYEYESYSKDTSYNFVNFVQSKVLVYKKPNEAKVHMDIINYIPTKNTIKQNLGKLIPLTLNNLKSWSGHIEYSHFNNKVFHLLSVERGITLKSDPVSSSEKSSAKDFSIASVCTVCIPKFVKICIGPIPGFPNDPVCTLVPNGQECIDYCPGLPIYNPGAPPVGDSGMPAAGPLTETAELKAFESTYRLQMSTKELAIFDKMTRVNQLRYLVNARAALNEALQVIPALPNHYTSHGTDDRTDAFRHAYFSLWNTFSIGRDLAKQLGDAHEEKPWVSDQDDLSRSMDLYNNYAGREAIDLISKDYVLDRRSEFVEIIKTLVNSGRMKYMRRMPDGSLYLEDSNVY